MRRQALRWILPVCLLLAGTPLAAQSYQKLWKETETYQKKDMPKSVIQLADKIYRKAERERNFPQMLCAFSVRMDARKRVSADSAYIDLSHLEQWAVKERQPVQKSLLYMMVGNMCSDMAGYANRSDKKVEASRPQSYSEWTSDMFVDRAAEADSICFVQMELLGSTGIKGYEVLIEKGEESRYFDHDLLSLVMHNILFRADKDHAVPLLDRVIAYYDSKKRMDAALLFKAERVMLQYDDNEGKLVQLKKLVAEYEDSPVVPYVYESLLSVTPLVKDQYELCQYVKQHYPHYKRINFFENKILSLTAPWLRVEMKDSPVPHQRIPLEVNVRAIDKLNLAIIDEKTGKPVQEKVFYLHNPLLYEEQDTTLYMDALPAPGRYMLQALYGGKKKTMTVNYTSLQPVGSFFGKNGEGRIYVLDRETGHPVEGATAEFFTRHYDRRTKVYTSVHTQVTNRDGELVWNKNAEDELYLCVSKPGCGRTDTLSIGRSWGYDVAANDKEWKTYTRVYTDRRIYRPGQTVQLSGIVYQQNADKAKVVPGQEVSLSVQDGNGEKIGTLKLATNQMGTFSGSVSLPEKVRLGDAQIVDGNNGYVAGFSIEEYKRPGFQVEFRPVKTVFGMNDSIRLEGEAMTYTGTPVRNAVVNYTINRSYTVWRKNDKELTLTGTVSTDDKGHFVIPMFLEVEKSKVSGWNSWWLARFKVQATVTSVAGETQEASKQLQVNLQPLQIAAQTPSVIMKEKTDSIKVEVRNSDWQLIQTDGRYDIFSLNKNNKGEEVKGDSLMGGSFTAQRMLTLPLGSLPSGKYRIRYAVETEKGKKVSQESDFVLFSASDRKSPVQDGLWTYFPDEVYTADKPATFYMASSGKDAYLIYNVFNQEKLVESKRFILNDSLLTFTIKDRPGYEKGVTVQWFMVKDGQVYADAQFIRRELPERTLRLKWETFRDRLTPGQSEEWRLKILLPNGKPADAEVLAGMYDASLDRYASNTWGLSLSYSYGMPALDMIGWYAGRNNRISLSQRRGGKEVPQWRYDNWIPELAIGGIPLNQVNVIGYRSKRQVVLLGSVAISDTRGSSADMDVMQSKTAVQNDNMDDVAVPEMASGSPEGSSSPQEIRTNFQETAFFYPHIRTDKNGVATIAFTLPESLTTWNFMALAHTKDMNSGTIRSTVTVSKDFMLQPHLPRFVRVGDKMELAATVDNRSTKAVAGVVRMELFDPMDNKVYASQKKNFSVKANSTAAVSFQVTVQEANLLACRMVAEGDSYSDGEQRYLPVLSNKEWITESQTLTANGAGHFETRLDSLFNHQSNTATRRRYTVEYTNNPAWLAVMALPSLSNPSQDDVLSLASAYYATSLARWIAEQHPRIKQVCEAWKAQGGTSQTLWSQLQKNEELKNIVLQETPWLMDAKDEAAQRRMLSTLFDVNSIQSKTSYYLQRLSELQMGDGSWCWFKGMPGSRFMTNQVVETLLRLNKLTQGKYSMETQTIVNKGMGFLAWSLEEEYSWLKEQKREQVLPSEMAVHFLYLQSMHPVKLDKNQAAAYNYCLDMMAHSSDKLTILGKAVGTQVLAKAGKKSVSQDFMQSIMQYSVYKKDMGRYYDAGIARYSWSDYRIPTQTMVIEACHASGVADSIVNQYAQWILRQKQVQAWSNPMNSVNAVYALLSSQDSLLDATPAARLTIDRKAVVPDASDATLGYVKQTTVLKDKEAAPRSLTIEKTDSHMGWGAVYAQYLEELSKVGKQSGELSIKRTLLVWRNVNGKEVWQEIKPGDRIRVGDRILSRLTVSCDRDMDFVMIEDKIAACMEPGIVRSGYDWSTGYSKTVKDTSTRYFANQLRKGVHLLDTEYTLTHAGSFRLGVATVQSAYAPEMNAHSDAAVIVVER